MGSSRIRTLGLARRALRISTRCFSPAERRWTGASRSTPRGCPASRALSLRTRALRGSRKGRSSPRARFSATVWASMSSGCWGTRAMPRAWAAMPIRPPSRVAMAILKPSPSLPSRFSLGTFTSLKINSAVEEERIPILS